MLECIRELSFHACLQQAWKKFSTKGGVSFCVLFVATTINTATAEEDVKDFDCACASSRTCFQRVFGKSTWSIPISCSPASVPLAVTLHYLHTVTARFGAACSAHPVPIQCPTSAHHSAHHSAQQQIMVFAALARLENRACMA